jgi:hypothetical protein
MHAERPGWRDRRRAIGVSALTPFALFCTCSPAAAEPFIGQFELKTLESAPGSFEFQSQNAWLWRQPARRIASEGDESEFDENAALRERYAIELERGFTNVLKMRVGVEFERERLDEPETISRANDFDDLSFTEIGAEVIAVLAPREGNGAGFGLVAEIEGPVDQEESNHLTLGAIGEFQSGRWLVAAVPMVVHAFGGDADAGEPSDNKWDFAYAAQLAYTFSASWSLALEGYGTVERLGSSGRASESARIFGDFNQHRVGPVLFYTHAFTDSPRREPPDAGEEETGASLTIGLGIFEGLNDDTADHTLKLSIEVDF